MGFYNTKVADFNAGSLLGLVKTANPQKENALLAGYDIYNKQQDKELEKQRLLAADDRANQQLLLQQQAGQRQEALFNNQLQDRQASQLQDQLLSQGFQASPGVLNEAVTPAQVEAMSFTNPQMSAIDKAGYDAIGYTGAPVDLGNIDEYMKFKSTLTPEQLQAFGAARDNATGLLNSPQAEAQLKLSTIANSDKVNEDRVGQLTRVANEIAAQGLPVPKELRTTIENQLLADSEKQQTELKGYDKQIADAKDKLLDNRMDMYKNVDKVTKERFTQASKGISGSNGSYTDTDVIKGSRSIVNKIASEAKSSSVTTDKVTEVTTKAITAYNEMVDRGIHPLAAEAIIESKIRGKDYKDGWLLFNDDAKVDFSVTTEDVSNAMAMSGANSGQKGILDASVLGANERTALAQERNSIEKEIAKAQQERNLAAMAPDERRLYSLRQAIGKITPERKPVNVVDNKTTKTVTSSTKPKTIAETLYPDGSKDGKSYVDEDGKLLSVNDAYKKELASLKFMTKYEDEENQDITQISDNISFKKLRDNINNKKTDNTNSEILQLKDEIESKKSIGKSTSQLESKLVNLYKNDGYTQASSPVVVDKIKKVEDLHKKIRKLETSKGASSRTALVSAEMKLKSLINELSKYDGKVFSLNSKDSANIEKIKYLIYGYNPESSTEFTNPNF